MKSAETRWLPPRGSKADYTLLTFNSGDLMPMVQNTKNRSSNFRILAIMAVDKQLIFKGEQTKYADFKGGNRGCQKWYKKIVIGGSKETISPPMMLCWRKSESART